MSELKLRPPRAVYPQNLNLQVLQVSETERRTQAFPQFEPVLLGDGHKDVNDLGIKLAARTALNLLAGMGHGQSPAIGPIADHSVQRVRDREYASSQRDLVAPQAARIARAVKKLLVGQHDL